MSKHTPWEIEWGNPIAIGGGIAFVPQSLDGTHTATAYLISQAPAMLEALEHIAASLYYNDYGDPALLNSFDESIIDAAIKAAKGEA